MNISPAGVAFIKQWEGFSAVPYQDDAGVWTQGYGETNGVTENSPPVTEDKATENLIDRLGKFAHAVETYITIEINQNQFDALCSLVYNVGTSPLQLTLGHVLNQGKYEQAADCFLEWDHIHQHNEEGELIPVVVEGLLNRRKAERELFNTPTT